ncbi:MAG: HigA family addiction module antitoxin [Rhodospirillales bacterium]
MQKCMLLIHPGEILLEDVIKPLGMTVHGFARVLRVPATRMSEIVHGRRAVTADTALRLARYLGTTAQFWTNLQAAYDLKVAEAESGAAIARDVLPRDAA